MDIFCKIVKGEIPSKTIYEDEVVMVIMDVNPRSNGHCLIIPKKHYQDLFDIEDSVLDHIMKKGKEMAEKLNGTPRKPHHTDKVVANVLYRDATLLDQIYAVK